MPVQFTNLRAKIFSVLGFPAGFTPNEVVIGAVDGLAQVAGLGTAAEVLTSQGPGQPPHWAPGGGGGSLPPVGPSATYTFVSGDVTSGASFWGGACMHIIATWAPDVSGTVPLIPPQPIGDPDDSAMEYYIWQGTTANVNYPDGTAASGSFTGGIVVSQSAGQLPPGPSMYVQAGVSYTVMAVDINGTVGAKIDLNALYNCLYALGGGIATPGPFPAGWAAELTTTADHSAAALRPVPVENMGVANGAFSTFNTETATGPNSMVAGGDGTASGGSSHVSGIGTTASGAGSSAAGNSSSATAAAAHAEGYNGSATRVGESALGGGVLDFTHPVQSSRLVAGVQTTTATAAAPKLGAGGSDAASITLTDNRLTLIKGWVAAAGTSGAVAKAWEISALIDMASGTPRLVGSATITVLAADAGASAWSVTVTAAATDPVKVTGQASTTVNWTVHLMLTETPNP